MITVFVGGSRRITRLNAGIRQRLDKVVEKAYRIVIGDANGADKAVQAYLASKHYSHVTVFCTEGGLRNNIGKWETRVVSRGTLRGGFEYYALKDRAMAAEATNGLMLWDGESRGTLTNTVTLLSTSKIVLLYVSPLRRFVSLTSLEELSVFSASAPDSIGRVIHHHLAHSAEPHKPQIDLLPEHQPRSSGHW